MVDLRNVSPSDFYKSLQGKKLYLFGAGMACANYHEVFCHFYPVQGIVDNNPELWGQEYVLNGQKTKIISKNEFSKILSSSVIDNVVLLITATIYGFQIVKSLDDSPEFSGLQCYLGYALRFFPIFHEKIRFTKEPRKIPKKIHYCWFGGSPIPGHLQQNIDGWKRLCPDYEITEWNESNYDVSKNTYMREAYEAKKWGFVPDYAREDIICSNGGIYLDTDVELLCRPDKFLNDDAFFGFCGNDTINLGLGFGAVPGHPLIKALRDYYDDKNFIKQDGSLNLAPCHLYNHPVLKDFGFVLENRLQRVNGVVVYPSDVLADAAIPITGNTISRHHTQLSWSDFDARKSFFEMRENLFKVR